MNSECLIYITLPFIVGFFIERYKNISTSHFFILVLCFFIALKGVFFLLYQDGLIPDLFEIIIGGSTVLTTTLIFHFQKVLRNNPR